MQIHYINLHAVKCVIRGLIRFGERRAQSRGNSLVVDYGDVVPSPSSRPPSTRLGPAENDDRLSSIARSLVADFVDHRLELISFARS